MSYYSRDLTGPCACADQYDGEWFLSNPSRSKYIREPWHCEEVELAPEHQSVLSQIVAVWIERSIDDAVKVQAEGVVTVHIHRRSFLFVGEADWTRIDSDVGVERFMLFINDDGNATGARPN